MIVRCPDCASRYRVREEKLPPGGGNIQCPSCGTVFPTMPPTPRNEPAPTMQAHSPPVAQSQAAPAIGQRPQGLGGRVHAQAGTGVPSPPPEPATVPAGNLTGNWKLKTPVGLVYDFPHIDALRNWLATRENFDGMVASRDGGKSWSPITTWPDLLESLPKGRTAAMTAPVAPPTRRGSADYARTGTPVGSLDSVNRLAGPRPTATQAKQPVARRTTASRPTSGSRPGVSRTSSSARPASRSITPSRRQEPQTRAFFGVVLSVIIILAAVLHATNVIDIPEQLGLTSENPNRPPLYPEPPPERLAAEQAAIAQPTTNDPNQRVFRSSENWDDPSTGTTRRIQPPSDPFDGRSAIEVARQGEDPHALRMASLMEEGDRAALEGDYNGAIAVLSSASQLDRDNPDIICRLAAYHRGAGHLAESEALQAQCENLRRAAQSP